jgi:hypothetical protein
MAGTMTPKAALGVFIRVFGLLIIAYALFDELFALLEAWGFVPGAVYPASRHGLIGLLYLLIGVVTVGLADPIAKLAYWSDRDT